jgi:hypothetical protein
MLLQYIGLALLFIVLITLWSLAMLFFFKGGKIWTSESNDKIKDLMRQEREIIDKISEEINNAGIINRWYIKKKMGPKLYEWYATRR